MTNQDPPLDDIPSFKLDSDEISRGPKSSTKSSAKRKGKVTTPKAASAKKGGSGALWFVTLLLLSGLGGTSYFFYMQNQMLNTELESAKARLSSLEQRLSVTDEGITQSGAVMQVKLKELDSEVRKLWDVANKRNKAWIKENQVALGSSKSSISKLKKDGESRAKSIANIKTKLKQNEALERTIAEVERQVTALAVNVESLDYADKASVSTLSTKVVSLSDEQKRQRASIEKRLKEAELAIDAFDSQRLQINRSLQQLKSQLQSQSAAQKINVPAAPVQ